MEEKSSPNPAVVRLVMSWGVTVCLFCIYYFLFTPLLETPLQERVTDIKNSNQVVTESPYARFFPPEAWERNTDQGNFLKSNNIVMLFQNLKFDEEARAVGDKCTILIAPGESCFPMRDPPGKPFHPLKISILGGVEIQFAAGEDLSKSRPLGGRLNGPVTMNYKAEIEGQLLDCVLITSDLFCDMQSVQTQKSVNFRIGPLEGTGEQLNVQFSSELGQSSFNGIQSVRLEHLKEIVLHVTPMLLQGMNLKMTPEMQDRMMKMFSSSMEIPVTLTCGGPMLYDVEAGTVTFYQNVTLKCEYAELPFDSLKCDELVLNLSNHLKDRLQMRERGEDSDSFEDSENTAAVVSDAESDSRSDAASEPVPASVTASASEGAEEVSGEASVSESENGILSANEKVFLLESILARQNVALNFPTFDCRAAGDALEFHLANRTIQLSGSQQAAIASGGHEFHANTILYTLPPQGQSFGKVYVNGNGWFRTIFPMPESELSETANVSGGNSPGVNIPGENAFHAGENSRKAVPLVMNWRQELSTRNEADGSYSFLVSGEVELNCDLYGKMNADRIRAKIRPKTEAEIQAEVFLASQMGVSSGGARNRVNSGKDEKSGDFMQNYTLESLEAEGNIKLNVVQKTAKLTAALERISLQFQPAAEIPEGISASKNNVQKSDGASGWNRMNSGDASGTVPTSSSVSNEGESQQFRFALQAGTLHGKVLLLPGKEMFYISEMVLEGSRDRNLVLREDIPLAPSEYAVSLQAKSVSLHSVTPKTLQCEILGSPALLGGRGVWLESSQIALNCAANRIDINNSGTLRLYTRQKADSGLQVSTLTETKVTWAGSMNFNGELLTVQNNVEITAPFTKFQAQKICATLAEKIFLSDPPLGIVNGKMNMETAANFFNDISAEQDVALRREMYDKNNRLVGILNVETQCVSFQPAVMMLRAVDRGTLRMTFLSDSMKFDEMNKTEGNTQNEMSKEDAQNAESARDAQYARRNTLEETPENGGSDFPAGPESPEVPKKPEWYQVFMEYYGGIQGNLLDGEFHIDRNISAIGFPVPSTEYRIPAVRVEPRSIPKNGLQFECDHLTLNQTPLASNGKIQQMAAEEMNLELVADGNVHLENSTFSVDGQTLKYDQSKKTCIVTGTPGMPVYVIYQEFLGGMRREMEAGSVEINLSNSRYRLDDVMINNTL